MLFTGQLDAKCQGVVLFVCALLLTGAMQAHGHSLSPSETVKAYCEADYLGKRLNYVLGEYGPTDKLLSWYGVKDGNESGYDIIYIIEKYKIVDEKIFGDKAIVNVDYYILCTSSAYEVVLRRRVEREKIEMVVVNGEWRLLWPVSYPRVSVDVGIRNVEKFVGYYTNDPGKKNEREQCNDELALLQSIKKRIEQEQAQ